MSNKEAAGILRGIKNRIEDLEEAVSTADGVPNLLADLTERTNVSDTTDARENDAEAVEETTSSDATDARENDAATTDGSTTSDSASRSTGDAGAWTWGESNWNFAEWTDQFIDVTRSVADTLGIGDPTSVETSDSPDATSTTAFDDPATVTEQPAGGFSWNDSDWNFDEWSA